jgi:hypothetical protein
MDPEGVQKAVTEIIIDEMVMLDSKPHEQPKEDEKPQEAAVQN